MRPPTPGQVAQLLEFAFCDPVLHLYLTPAARTGARRGQLLALRWVDVDLVGGSLSIQRSLVEGPDGPRMVPTKARRSYRVALDEASVELLRSHRQATSTGGGVMAPDNHFVFSSDKEGTRPWSPNFVTKRFIRVRRAAGLEPLPIDHYLRHFMATQMLDAGVPIPIVAARLCHARASTTSERTTPTQYRAETGWPQKLCGGGSVRPAAWTAGKRGSSSSIEKPPIVLVEKGLRLRFGPRPPKTILRAMPEAEHKSEIGSPDGCS